LELDGPIRVLSWSLSPDSAGAGRWRGGVGTTKTFEVITDGVVANYRGERHSTAPWGSQGGGPASHTSAQVQRSSGEIDYLQSKTMLALNDGDQLTVNLSGGGGYGPALKRDPDAVLWDVKNYRVTKSAARSDYGVVITNSFEVDAHATKSLRTELSKQ